MSDDLRKRAEDLLNAYAPRQLTPAAVNAMLAFAAEQVAAERARCAKVCRDLATGAHQIDDSAKYECAEAIEKDAT